MTPVLKEKSKRKAVKGETLADIAEEAGPEIDWQTVARFNWGTDRPIEVLRAIAETIGVELKHLGKKSTLRHIEKLPFTPHKDVKAEIRIPQIYISDPIDVERRHLVKVKALTPATAVSILGLDPWFLPGIENCEILYELSGLEASADKLQMDVFASNYCTCTDWNDGLGTYAKDDLEKEPVYFEKDLKSGEHDFDVLKWSGACNTDKGLLAAKASAGDTRHINVVFSPYTVQFTYHKAALDPAAKPLLLLKPFWPRWTLDSSTPAATADGSQKKFTWTNAADQDGGAIEIKDAQNVVVFREGFNPKLKKKGKAKTDLDRPKALKAGEQSFRWNGKYRDGFLNGAMDDQFIDDNAAPWTDNGNARRNAELLYRSTPYTATVTTVKHTLVSDSLKLGWKIENSGGKFKRGFYRIRDRFNRTVYLAPLAPAKMADGEHDVTWDGKYPEAVKNSQGGDKVIPYDMPYRLEVQVHTEHGQAEGLALAAMHSEVRLYTHAETYATVDPRFDTANTAPSMMLEPGPLLAKAALAGGADLAPDVEPATQATDEWARFKLAEFGYHPGPLHRPYDPHFTTAIKEFKRSVPANGGAAAGAFTRLDLSAAAIEARDAALRTAITSCRATDKRAPYADPARISANSDTPDLTGVPLAERLRKPDADLAVWADDRQYYTAVSGGAANIPRDENNNPFFTGNPARVSFDLGDYRGGMSIGDTKTTTDAAAIPRPWLPMMAAPTLMGRGDTLFDDPDDGKVKVTDPARRQAIEEALGPLRVNWSVEELPFDVSTIDTSAYPSSHNTGSPPPSWTPGHQTRTRRYVSWALWNEMTTTLRKDTKRTMFMTNCKEAAGGVRPTSPQTYASKVFGNGDEGLWPCKAEAINADEVVATVVHDLLKDDQGPKNLDKPLVADLRGKAAAYFRPSIIAGDGYRISARVEMKKTGSFDFPNIDALKDRYPVLPEASSARMRVWRRSSFRGYACWGAATGHWGNAMINDFRDHYKAGHCYFVHEGGGPATHNLNSIYDATNAAHVTKYSGIVQHNVALAGRPAFWQNPAIMNLDATHVHPWGARNDLGVPTRVLKANRQQLEDRTVNLWRAYRAGLLMGVTQQVESNGYMRGHLFVEFTASPNYYLPVYTCSGGTTGTHQYVYMRKTGTAGPANGANCPTAGCAGTGGRLAHTASYNYNVPLNFPAVGSALGACWLFTSSDAETWTHEVGHHRHFEHAAHAPGFRRDSHDSQNNAVITSWEKIWWDDHPRTGTPAATHIANGRTWDRRCIMSYASDGPQYFCGKCVLRNRGWRVTGLGGPGTTATEVA